MVLFFSRTIQRIFLSSPPLLVRHTEAVFKLVDLEAFPTTGVWACPTLTSSHIAAKLEHKLSLCLTLQSCIPTVV